MNYQANATFQALIEQGVPSARISLTDPGITSIAHLIAFVQSAVYYLCVLLGVNWANNPKVVIGKEICNEALENKLSTEQLKKNREDIAFQKFKDFF